MATSVKLDNELRERVRRLAEARQRSAHWIMVEAIRDYVTREEARESFRQEALASWEATQATGRHLTGAEVRDWLITWGEDGGDDEEGGPPESHE